MFHIIIIMSVLFTVIVRWININTLHLITKLIFYGIKDTTIFTFNNHITRFIFVE